MDELGDTLRFRILVLKLLVQILYFLIHPNPLEKGEGPQVNKANDLSYGTMMEADRMSVILHDRTGRRDEKSSR